MRPGRDVFCFSSATDHALFIHIFLEEIVIPEAVSLTKWAAFYGFKSLPTNELWTPKLPAMDNVTMTEAVGHVTGNIVRWEAVEGARLYQLFRRAANESTRTLVTNTGSTAYKDTTAQSGVRYYYKVVACSFSIKRIPGGRHLSLPLFPALE